MSNNENISQIREFLIYWNNTFVLDYWYRKKYNIPFNSKKHRNIEPISIFLEWEEEQLETVIANRDIERKKKEEYIKTGIWISKKNQDSFYDNIDESFFEAFDDKK